MRVAQGGPQVGRQPQRDLDRLAERATEQVFHGHRQAVDIDRLGIERLPPREGEEPVGQRGGTAGGGRGGAHVALDIGHAPLLDALADEIEAT